MNNLLFETYEDKLKFLIEEDVEDNEPDNKDSIRLRVDELIVSNRAKRKRTLKNYRKSMMSKRNWLLNRRKIMKGISKFTKSTKGKQFHRILGRKIATRDFKTRPSIIESLIALNSLKVHLWIGHKYSSSIDEEVEYEIFFDEAIGYINEIESRVSNILFGELHEEFELSDDETNFLNDLISSNGAEEYDNNSES